MGYKINPNDPDLVAGWNIGQSPARIIQDVGPGGFQGAIVGNPIQRSDKFGKALAFDGSSGNYLNCGLLGDSIGASFTVMSWFSSTTGGSRIMVCNNGATRKFDFYLNPASGRLVYYDGTSVTVSVQDLRDGKKHQAGFTVTGGQVQFIIDGDYVDPPYSITEPTVAGAIVTVAGNDVYNPFEGSMYNAAIYNKVKSPEWVEYEYKRAKKHF